VGEEQGVSVNPLRLDGTYDETHRPYAGRLSHGADFGHRSRLPRAGACCEIEGTSTPIPCWPLRHAALYYAKQGWYIRTSQCRDRLLAANETSNWHPEHIKHGRSASGWRTT